MCLSVGLLVCWSAFYRPHDICPLCGAASEWPREQEPSSRAAPRARGRKHAQRARAGAQACTARARASMPYNFSTKISYADPFQKQNRTRARSEPTLVSSSLYITLYHSISLCITLYHSISLYITLYTDLVYKPPFTSHTGKLWQ